MKKLSFKKFLPQRKRWWAVIAMAAFILLLVIGKKDKDEKVTAVDYDPETTPTMYTADATSYVSDSGYTRYYIETTQWYIFDEAKEPNWKFPEGLYGEKFDDNMAVIATFECDSAVYLSSSKLWELIGNVRINNELGDRFLTQHMFWNTGDHKMYSDSFIHIEKSDRIIEGYGFVSDERISDYVVNRPSMIIPASELNRDRSQEEVDTDSVAPADSIPSGQRRRQPPRPREGYAPVISTTETPTPSGHVPGSHNDRKRAVTSPVSDKKVDDRSKLKPVHVAPSDQPLKIAPQKSK